jgi:RHS repeat-associated protein
MTRGPLPANINANSTLIWDGENRLIEAQVNSGATVNYLYDAQSRRIAETVGTATTGYIYDGWNPIAEYNTTYALTKTYTWGIDLSGSMQGAGGVGGLLSVTDGTGTYFPTFDGNGNVSEYLDSNGSTVAHYEYDPFGKTTVATGTKAQDFAHRFSTKPLDTTTGLYYYGYRFYDPETGRWPSRDPIQELGGLNLYGFLRNNSIGKWDYLGMVELDEDDKKALAECNTRLTEGKKNEKVAGLLKMFDDENCKLNLDCLCCNKDERSKDDEKLLGFYHPASNETRICAGKHKDQDHFNYTLYEELAHALQKCGKIKTPVQKNACDSCLCREIQAKANAPGAPDRDSINIQATFSCLPHCVRPAKDHLELLDSIEKRADELHDECSKIE